VIISVGSKTDIETFADFIWPTANTRSENNARAVVEVA